MALKATNPTTTNSWKELQSHFESIKSKHLKDLFKTDPDRAKDLTVKWDDFYVDFSKNRITKETLDLLIQLANEVDLKDAISKYFDGDVINETEGRAVLHTALRANEGEEVLVENENVVPIVHAVLDKIESFTKKVISGDFKGFSGKPITDRSTKVIKYLAEKSNKAFPIIGVGGIHSADDASKTGNFYLKLFGLIVFPILILLIGENYFAFIISII